MQKRIFVASMKKLLIYDDEPDILDVCQRILGNSYKIESLRKVKDPVAEVLKVNPGLILMDVWIPEIGGEESTRSLKQDERTTEIPVILFSANNDLANISKKAGADGYIMKPFNIETLRKTIELYIG